MGLTETEKELVALERTVDTLELENKALRFQNEKQMERIKTLEGSIHSLQVAANSQLEELRMLRHFKRRIHQRVEELGK